MIIAMSARATEAEIAAVTGVISQAGLNAIVLPGGDRVAIGVASAIPHDLREPLAEQISGLPEVDHVAHVSRPYKLASREFHSADTVIEHKGVTIGAGEVVIFAGPCAVETPEQMAAAAKAVKAGGAKVMRGGAFKPRTSPYSFQGMGEEGVRLLVDAARSEGLLTICEVLDEYDVGVCGEIDFLQVGARNMQNYRLLTAVGRSGKPVLLKRGPSATIDEWLLSAEYILCQDNPNVILCERGMHPIDRTYTRYTLDVSAVPVARRLSHLPVFVDPSHAAGDWKYVSALALAGVAAGADGLIVEVHPDPAHARCDGPQALKPDVFLRLAEDVRRVAGAVGRPR
jgi:3-deoxy-7-phosphoheptulonate synthase